MSHNWLQTFRRNLGIPGLHISTDKPDSCQHRTQRFPGTVREQWRWSSSRPGLKRCWYCSPMYRGRHRARTVR